MGPAQRTGKSKKDPRHDPLHVQMTEDPEKETATKKPRAKFIQRSAKKEEKDEEFVNPKISRKILEIAREQQDEEEQLDETEHAEDFNGSTLATGKQSAGQFDIDSDEYEEFEHTGENDGFGQEYVEELELDEADQDALSKFLPSAPRERRNLADVIMEKINAQNGGMVEATPNATHERTLPQGVNPKIIEAYTKVGLLLSRYTSGKVPKAFKIIPSLPNWEEILYLTQPENWTPHAAYQATRIFVSNLKAKQSQRFFQLVLLDRVRDDIADTKKLNYHLYMALKKALYKPSAFFKGILFPLCESGTCTLREAAIIGSVISKVSIPVLHSSAALLKIAEMEYTGPNSLFIRILLDKKYALPFKVVDALVFHFLRFKNDSREMPVLWHQAFLVFAQRYKEDMTPEQKEALLELLKYKFHEGISQDIRRELANSSCRGEVMEVTMMEM